MGDYTRYLSATQESPQRFTIRVIGDSAIDMLADTVSRDVDFRYSPIFPAYLDPDEVPPPPSQPGSIAFYFAQSPSRALERLKSELTAEERFGVFFSQGLAAILIIDVDESRSRGFLDCIPSSQFEYWKLVDGALDVSFVVSEVLVTPDRAALPLTLVVTGNPELDVYIEQIAASMSTLWHFYGVHCADERKTLVALSGAFDDLIKRYENPGDCGALAAAQRRNAIVSALVELSATLSYSVTQGSTGASPILANRSPFPHHSLLGVGGAVRGLTRFTRYLEAAFVKRSAEDVISREYASRFFAVPKISTYESGEPYHANPTADVEDEFDLGGALPEVHAVPLLTQFSLRHGFKESKYSVTAASESLNAETLPQWTMLTLSHEIMHSRVRDIFQALFGTTWEETAPSATWGAWYREFKQWYENPSTPLRMDQALRALVLNFCCAMPRVSNPVLERRPEADLAIRNPDELLEHYRKYKMLAEELFAHFHDYYFAFACQRSLYIMSIWASWAKVAAPFLRPSEYLVRTLATVAAGTGVKPRPAFDAAVEQFLEALDALESGGRESPLFDQVRLRLKDGREDVFALFKVAYYLADHVRKWFSSQIIASSIDRIDSDPFAEGSSDAEDYVASVYVFGNGDGDGAGVSPVRFCLATLVAELKGLSELNDHQWLTARNSIVIRSQEVFR